MKPIYYIACSGSKSINDYEFVATHIAGAIKDVAEKHRICFLLSDESGVPFMVHQYAKTMGMMVQYFPTHWNELKGRAPVVRNKEMLAEANAVIVFWDGMNSQGLELGRMAKEAGTPMKAYRL